MASMTNTLSCEALGEVGPRELGLPVGTEYLFLAWKWFLVANSPFKLFGQVF